MRAAVGNQLLRKLYSRRMNLVAQREDRRRLAALPLRMDHEILLLADKRGDIRQTRGRGKHVVFGRIARPSDVEELLHAGYYSIL